MASLNHTFLMTKIFLKLFSIAIIASTLAICETNHIKIPSLNTPIFDTKNSNDSFISHFSRSIQDSINAVSISSKNFDENGSLGKLIKTPDQKLLSSSIASCRKLLSLATYNLNLSLSPDGKTLEDFKMYLCGTMAYIDACSDAFQYAPKRARDMVAASLDSSRNNINKSLTILSTIDDHDPNNIGSLVNGGTTNAWPHFSELKKTYIDVVVAKDGSGKFKTINEAIKFAPEKSTKQFVIYVKKGTYYENVILDANKWNIVMFGDGMYNTIISGHHGNATGWSTTDSATFAVYGQGFVAMNIGFENTAGPSGGQAVAFLSGSDQSALYRCSISGYQDTLCSISGRQFYRECIISGTTDFIFGAGSSAVFQACAIRVRKPRQGNGNTITAQGKSDPRCPCGFSFHKSFIETRENLAGVNTYLGRPWGAYSTVVFMESYMGEFINPEGWSPWSKGETIPNTVYYGEFYNKWKGVHRKVREGGVRPYMSAKEARAFTVTKFVGGNQWLPMKGVPFMPNL